MASATSPIRLALLGTGRMGHIHLQNILKHPTATVSHVFGDTGRGRDMQRNCGLTPTANTIPILPGSALDAVLDSASVPDGVVVASSTAAHFEQVLSCVSRGVAVYVEKPLAQSVAQIDQLYTTCSRFAESTPPIFVGYQRRFDPSISRLCKYVRSSGEESVGVGLQKITSTSRDPTYPELDVLARQNVNGFHDSIVHDLDIICHLAEEYPTRVYSAARAIYLPIESANDFDRVYITLEFESGLLAAVDWCRHSGSSYDQRLEVCCSDGSRVEVVNEDDNAMVAHVSTGSRRSVSKAYFLERYAAAYENEIKTFVEALQERLTFADEDTLLARGWTNYEQVRNVSVLIDAAQESARSGKPVDICYERDKIAK